MPSRLTASARGLLAMVLTLAAMLTSSTGAAAISPLQAGPGASGPNTYRGAVDVPLVASAIQLGAPFVVAGWACDTSAEGWAGFDQLRVYSGTMDDGVLLASGGVGQPRPDVAATSGLSSCGPSGFAAVVP